MEGESELPPTDERLADPEAEGLIDEADRVPDEERVVPEDVNDYVADDEPDDFEPG